MAILKFRVLFTFLRLNIADKIAKGKKIIAGLTLKSAELPNPPIAIAEITTLNSDLDGGYQAAETGNNEAKSALPALEAKWKAAFQKNGEYVDMIANGDKALIVASGYDASSGESISKQIPVTLTGLTSKATEKTGEIDVTSDKQKDAAAIMVASVPVGTVVTQVGRTVSFTIGGNTISITLDTHHNTKVEGLASALAVSVYGLAFNGKGIGPIISTPKSVKPE